MKPRVLIIFPEYFESQSSHYPYWYRLYDEAAKKLEVRILFETNSGLPKFKNISKVITCKFKPKPFNLLFRLFEIHNQVKQGFTNIYIHYSLWSVILCRIIKIVTPITVNYWDCEWYDTKPKNYLLDVVIHYADSLVTASPTIADQYKKIFGLKRAEVVTNWSEYVPVKKVILPKEKINVLFVHRLAPRKGSKELPEIIKQTHQVIPNAHFHIIGGGPDLARLQSSNLADTTFYGALPLEAVRRYFASCDYFIMPSQSEGFPRVILEAENFKIPIVATRVGNVQEIVGDEQQHYLVSPGDPSAFVESLVKLIKAPDRIMHKMLKENFIQAQQYSLQKSSQQFVNLFISK